MADRPKGQSGWWVWQGRPKGKIVGDGSGSTDLGNSVGGGRGQT